MARARRPKSGKTKAKKSAKIAKSKSKRTKAKRVVKKAVKAASTKTQPVKASKAAAPKNHAVAKKPEGTESMQTTADKKPISPFLLRALKSRQKSSLSALTDRSDIPKKRGRRGRRPKGDYQPYNEDEEQTSAATRNEGLEYDTGIKFEGPGGEDGLSVFDRNDDYEKELDFDW